MKLLLSRRIFEKPLNIKFHENPSNESRVLPRGRTYVTKLIVAFRNFANAPKNGKQEDQLIKFVIYFMIIGIFN